ncbi:MAG: c-type cytochrome [Gemmatimonadaceae bacterium]|jgi:mono/diheme cytochrome c family protein|nr:c-type cytochrome [Gemmatimonadaceae bacterium]
MRSLALPVALVATLAVSACGGESRPADDASASATPAPTPVAAVSFDATKLTPAQLALGDSLFHGLIGATSCQACHGADGAQATMAPNLTDAEWLHSDGSLEGIYTTIKSGVMQPKQYSSVMPPYGGAPMTDEQTLAVAGYVWKLSHK